MNRVIGRAVTYSFFLVGTFTFTSPYADVMRSDVTYNNGIAKKTGSQPDGGLQTTYEVTLSGGALNECTVAIVETKHPYDMGAWGFYEISGRVRCDGGDFSYTLSGAWDANGFHSTGDLKGGSGKFENITGRVAQLHGGSSDAGNGTSNISYSLVLDLSQAK